MFKIEKYASLRYAIAVISIALATLFRWWLDPILETHIPFTTFYAAIMITAWYGGVGPSLLAIVSGAILASFLFVEPRGSIYIYDLEHQVGLGLYLLVGLVVTLLMESLRLGRQKTEKALAELAVAHDALKKEIAERKQAERWLIESEERFRSYFEQGLVGMAILSPKKEWIEANERLSTMLGYRGLETPAAPWSELTHEADRAEEERLFQRVEEGIVTGFTMDKRFHRRDGKTIDASIWVKALKDAKGAREGFLVLVQDISDRKNAEVKTNS